MKRKRPEGGASAPASSQWRKKKRQRLGGKGGGLSLEAFANAKSAVTGYNPALIKNKREFYKNVKILKKYRKSVKHQNHQEHGEHLDIRAASVTESEVRKKNVQRWKKKANGSLESIRKEYEKQREEKERARKEREAIIQAKKEERERAEGRRRALREKMFKRTSSGQPVMKYRIEHLLENLLQGASN